MEALYPVSGCQSNNKIRNTTLMSRSMLMLQYIVTLRDTKCQGEGECQSPLKHIEM